MPDDYRIILDLTDIARLMNAGELVIDMGAFRLTILPGQDVFRVSADARKRTQVMRRVKEA